MEKSSYPFVLVASVNNLLYQSECPAMLTIEQCASELAMSMTTFRRKLTEEETSFKLIQSKFLNELVVEALLSNKTNIEELAIKLGYSERATFERSFRKKFGISPFQFRELSLVAGDKECYINLTEIAKQIPPMSDSCIRLLQERDEYRLDVERVCSIVKQDPIFSGRVIGNASMAIYGKTPKGLSEAVGRNLGINTVVNFAVIFAVKDALVSLVDPIVIEKFTQAFMIAPKLFKVVRMSVKGRNTFDVVLSEQVLTFALLGVFLLTHKSSHKHEFIQRSLQGVEELQSMNLHCKQSVGISIFGASALMLSLWHIDAGVIKQINRLDNIYAGKIKSDKNEELLLFMLSCLYASTGGQQESSALQQQAELLGLECFNEVNALLF